jgi:hypothetical protein
MRDEVRPESLQIRSFGVCLKAFIEDLKISIFITRARYTQATYDEHKEKDKFIKSDVEGVLFTSGYSIHRLTSHN